MQMIKISAKKSQLFETFGNLFYLCTVIHAKGGFNPFGKN